MNKKLIILLIFFITGCWNYNELNTLAITTAMAIDKKGSEYEVSILIANAKNKASSSNDTNAQNIVYSAKGKTITEALKNIELKNPRKIYIGHLTSLIISEEVAKSGLINTLDLFLRNSESIKRFYVIIARNTKAKNILKIISPLETVPAQTITNNIKSSSETQGISIKVLYSDFINNLLKKGVEPTLPTITIEGSVEKGSKNSNLEKSEPDSYLKLGPIAAFKSDKLISYADADESRGINLILNKTKTTTFKFKCKNNYINIEIRNIKSKITIKNKVKINVIAKGEIVENACDINLNDPKTVEKIEKNFNKKIKSLINKGINFAKKNEIDIFGIGNILYKNNPKKFNKIKDWNKYFSNLKINVDVNATITTKGSSRKSLKEALHD